MNNPVDLNEFHWLLAIVQSIDVGVVVLDRKYRVQVWNTFMENRSGVQPKDAHNQHFFSLFPEVDQQWFSRKVESVAALGTPAFTVWEQRPYLVRFKNYQPITGHEAFMYQNTTLLPLRSPDSNINHICLVIYDVTDVATNRHQLQAANAQLQLLSSTDRLTGLYNRGHWEESLKAAYARHQRYGNNSSLVMFDIDHFKRVNDTYGHQAGDKVIEQVARLVREHVRDSDVAGRYGGEEFGVVLSDTDKAGARMFAERLRKAVEEMDVPYGDVVIRFTISLGVADLSRPSSSHAELIAWADEALYTSKKTGRNRVTVHE
ncbi:MULTISPECIES: GGDEF domain-containing protein [unclassified Pseudomonas]|uniref:GGDEF domain-containing protein n=1 Tax=unclassified Pseudomonas TaxID=196821 RepID=UPI00119A6DDC|nr:MULTISPECIES: diguanylate cyclase [unclassified Pseudomonas]TWC22934.1 diguanylate cyclase (GGDEF)-like protein [Pseudomonas sp. SJZ075]TWC24801.1 diguanylate cyclase (GGDEF)-like protein [Pseudomonas sp. SJZ074]TWC38186.1 diguanylate cyclase (GGDEF)-like protein [Pseudomonas sp. SJZ078]TWC40982.1 diguanylate cyclase (GGDEF)-like protein [Pseudomonas sp. SJZ085]TWC58776.1 diguanylate cyclase (GGDEF)-like protein [Pseudomonas sp. SJZ124]